AYSSSVENMNLMSPNGVNWRNLPPYVDQADVFGGYNHVARALGDNTSDGAYNSLPSILENGQSYTHTYQIPINTTVWELKNINVVAMMLNATTGEILNAV